MPDQSQIAKERIKKWGDFYLKSTQEMHRKALQHKNRNDYISAYLCLWVAFNNLYSLMSCFKGKEINRIKIAINDIPEDDLEAIFDNEYLNLINALNIRFPRELEPESQTDINGVLNMQDYFRGKPSGFVKSVQNVSIGTINEKRTTLNAVAKNLLYTVRNNLFHSIKGPQDGNDQTVVKDAYHLLEPLINPLYRKAEEKIQGIQ